MCDRAAKFVETQLRFGCLLYCCETPYQQPFCDAKTEIRFHIFKTCNDVLQIKQRAPNIGKL